MEVPLLDLKRQYAAIKDEIDAALRSVVESQHFILGPHVEKLEAAVADYCGTKYAVGCASGTDALLLALMAVGVGPGDEVITPTYTFFATAGSIARLGAKPVFVDIEPDTYNIRADQVEAKVSRATKAIVPVHLYGQCADMDAILAVARRRGLRVVEDAAQAMGAEAAGRLAGSMGDAGCISFFPSKNLGGFGDGGMVVSNDAAIADKVRLLRVHGGKQKYYHDIVGLNSRLDALQAAVLNVKIKYLDGWNEARRERAAYYTRAFQSMPVQAPVVRPGRTHIYHQYVIRAANRDGLYKHLQERRVGCALYYPLPLHLQACFRPLGYKEGDLPAAEAAAKSTLALPVFPELTQQEQDYVASSIREFVA
jgi:dTDP-4-amino-4,6-dideoxygalactose transaminase